jgi:hypothetical protein
MVLLVLLEMTAAQGLLECKEMLEQLEALESKEMSAAQEPLESKEMLGPRELLGFKGMSEQLEPLVSKETLERLAQRVISEPRAQRELRD